MIRQIIKYFSLYLGSQKLERIKGGNQELSARPGDIIGITQSCKAQYRKSAPKYGHVMMVAEVGGGKITKILHVRGKEGSSGGAYEEGFSAALSQPFNGCGYLIHIK